MVNISRKLPPTDVAVDLGLAPTLVGLYLLITAATVLALVVLAATAPAQATGAAWGHAVIVAAFAVLLPLRVRAARRGSAGARRASVIIAGVLLAVNLVEAALPGAYPVWMRLDMLVVAVVMAALVLVLARVRP